VCSVRAGVEIFVCAWCERVFMCCGMCACVVCVVNLVVCVSGVCVRV